MLKNIAEINLKQNLLDQSHTSVSTGSVKLAYTPIVMSSLNDSGIQTANLKIYSPKSAPTKGLSQFKKTRLDSGRFSSKNNFVQNSCFENGFAGQNDYDDNYEALSRYLQGGFQTSKQEAESGLKANDNLLQANNVPEPQDEISNRLKEQERKKAKEILAGDAELLTLKMPPKRLNPKYIQNYAHVRANFTRNFVTNSDTDRKKNSSQSPSSPLQTKRTVESARSQTRSQNMLNVSLNKRQFYFTVLKELGNMKFNESVDEVEDLIGKAEKNDQQSHAIMESKLGRKHANTLFFIMKQYSEDSGTNSNKLTYLKLLKLLSDFGLIGSSITKEKVLMLYSRRCHKNHIDFGAFIDILYKISKILYPNKLDNHTTFGTFIENDLESKIAYVLGKTLSKPSFTRMELFSANDSFDNEAIRIFEAQDELLKHLFMLYENVDFRYCQQSFLSLKAFKKFGQEFSLIPVVISLKEATEIFRRVQVGEHPIVDFKAFIKLMAVLAHIGFSKSIYQDKYNTFGKKATKLFEFLQEANAKFSDELVFNKLTEVREPKHVIA